MIWLLTPRVPQPLPRQQVGFLSQNRLNMEMDLQGLFGFYVTLSGQLYSLAETPQLPGPSPRIWTRITRALLVRYDRRHLFISPCFAAFFLPIELTDGRGGGGGREERKSQTVRWRESLILYNPLTTRWCNLTRTHIPMLNEITRTANLSQNFSQL